MMDVVIVLNLSGEGAVSDYKKLLQGLIWSKRGHARDLAGFLLANDLLTPADLDEAKRAAPSRPARRWPRAMRAQRRPWSRSDCRTVVSPAGVAASVSSQPVIATAPGTARPLRAAARSAPSASSSLIAAIASGGSPVRNSSPAKASPSPAALAWHTATRRSPGAPPASRQASSRPSHRCLVTA